MYPTRGHRSLGFFADVWLGLGTFDYRLCNGVDGVYKPYNYECLFLFYYNIIYRLNA